MAQRRRMRLAIGVALAALAIAACSSDSDSASTSSGGSKTTVTIAFVGPLTGPNSPNLGINIRNGAKTAVDEYNKRSDAKYTVVLKEFDSQGDPAQATTVKDSYINDTSIIGILGPAFSGETKAVLPSYDEAKLVMVSASATNTALPTVAPTNKVFHRAIADDAFQGKGIGDYIAKDLAAKKIVVIDDSSEYGKGLADDTIKELGVQGVPAPTRLSIPDPKAQDFSAQVNDAKAASPDVVMYGGYYEGAGNLRKQLVDAGVTAKFISGDGSLDPGFVTAAGATAADGALLSCPCNLAVAASPGKLGEFYTSYKAVNPGAEPGTYSPEAYDVANLFIQGIQAGNTDRAKMLSYINSVGTYAGISKTIEFEPNGNIKTPSLYVFTVKNGAIVPA